MAWRMSQYAARHIQRFFFSYRRFKGKRLSGIPGHGNRFAQPRHGCEYHCQKSLQLHEKTSLKSLALDLAFIVYNDMKISEKRKKHRISSILAVLYFSSGLPKTFMSQTANSFRKSASPSTIAFRNCSPFSAEAVSGSPTIPVADTSWTL